MTIYSPLTFLMQRSDDGVLIADHELVIHTVNSAAAAMLNMPAANLVGKSAPQIFAKNAALVALFDRSGEITFDVKLAKRRIAQGFGVTLADGDRIVMLHDVTEQRDLDSRREALVTTISHDLRNPLSVIYTYIDLVATSNNLSDEQQSQLNQARSATLRLHELLEDLVELAWVESGMPLRFTPVRFGELIDRAIEALTTKAHEHGVAFAVSIQQPMPAVMGDPDRLYIAVYQLLINAIQYSDAGSLIAIHAYGDDRESSLSIADRGFGISPQDQEAIFDRFFRSRDPRVQAIPGAGLGLTMGKRIVQRHGGAINVTSTLNVGSTFTMTLPAVES